MNDCEQAQPLRDLIPKETTQGGISSPLGGGWNLFADFDSGPLLTAAVS